VHRPCRPSRRRQPKHNNKWTTHQAVTSSFAPLTTRIAKRVS